ncbi:MAG: hypothetical protein ACKN9J_04050 [Holophagaceae bacterium]
MGKSKIIKLSDGGSKYREFDGYEKQYQLKIINNADILFPNYICVAAEPSISTGKDMGGEVRKPDLFLIHKEYKKWYVAEVELSHHDLMGHVVNQIQVFHKGEYNKPDVIQCILNSDTKNLLDHSQFANLIKEVPQVCIIVDRVTKEWQSVLKKYDPTFIEVRFYSEFAKDMYIMIDGEDLWEPDPSEITSFRFVRQPGPGSVTHFLMVRDVSNFERYISDDKTIVILNHNKKIPQTWQVQIRGSGKAIFPIDREIRNNLQSYSNNLLCRDEHNILYFKEKRP